MTLTVDKIETIAPDHASLAAAMKIKASSWPLLAVSDDRLFAWGECQGSGSAPYRACIHIPDIGYKCSCPSRKFPCKHSLSLMLMLAKAPQSFAHGEVPDWVKDWAGRRRPAAGKADAGAKPAASLVAAIAEQEPGARDEKSEARATAQRERLRVQREEMILRGLDELDLWISDHLDRGLANFMAPAVQNCRAMAQRLVDAKAPGVASWVDALPSLILSLPEAQRHSALIESLGDLHLLANAYRRLDDLPEPLRHDVRRIAGWTIDRQALLDMPDAKRAEGSWRVTGTLAEIQPDKLRRTETWLVSCSGGETVNAVLVDFAPVAAGASGPAFLPGERLEAELVFYPSAAPLRAIIARQSGGGGTVEDFAPSGQRLPEAIESYGRSRAAVPWLGPWQMMLTGVSCIDCGPQGLWLSDGTNGLPIRRKSRDDALILSGVGITSVTGLWDGRYFSPMMAATPLGSWVRQ